MKLCTGMSGLEASSQDCCGIEPRHTRGRVEALIAAAQPINVIHVVVDQASCICRPKPPSRGQHFPSSLL